MDHDGTESDFRSGYVALIGEPNTGKSTLLNALLRQKISIVTAKPQTTRHRLLGILSGDRYQVVFVDTPGIITPRYLLHEVMMEQANRALEDAEVVLLLVDAPRALKGLSEESERAGALVRESGKRSFLVITKIDLVDKPLLLPLIDTLRTKGTFDEIVPVSALKGDGTDELVRLVVARLPVHPPYYPPEFVSEAPERFFVSEIVREKIFERYSQEIPYSTSVDIVAFEERGKRKHFISADIIVERQSQKGILIGREGKALKALGEDARKDIEKFLEHPVYLELHVKIREQWREDRTWLRRLGYDKE